MMEISMGAGASVARAGTDAAPADGGDTAARRHKSGTMELSYVPMEWREMVPAGHDHRDVADVCVDRDDRV
jgi:hypothetical protein